MVGRKARKTFNRNERARIKQLSDDELMTLVPQLNKEIAELAKPISVLKGRLVIIHAELRARRTVRAGFVISDHAVVRYLQRVKLLDVEAVRDEILKYALEAKGGKFRRRHDNGLVFAMNDETKVVSTVLTPLELEAVDGTSVSPEDLLDKDPALVLD